MCHNDKTDANPLKANLRQINVKNLGFVGKPKMKLQRGMMRNKLNESFVVPSLIQNINNEVCYGGLCHNLYALWIEK